MKAKNILLLATALSNFWLFSAKAQQNWKIQPVTIQTRWAKNVSTENPLEEYPRPQLARTNWTNLNGLWDYAITTKDATKPSNWEEQILVPYPIESALSGVKKSLLPSQNLWYKRSFTKPALKAGEKLKLNFGAVDYKATVFINGTEVGSHEGGYTEFSFDITSALKEGQNEILVKVFDPSGEGVGPHGKQVLKPESIYYTPISGIWQTVWMETVPAAHIENLVITPDIDKGLVNITVKAATNSPVSLNLEGKTIKGQANTLIAVPVNNAKLWAPAHPNLYDLEVSLGEDKVKSYFGMRKISIAKDSKGIERIMLNNKPYFNLGTLDQGFWPEGLYTAPTDEALAWDIKAIKAMGFNTIRKHIKVEPARWYYHADKIGMLIWQDMVNPNQGLPEGSKAAFEKGAKETLAQLHNYPSISTWVLFNEAWGQYDQERLTKWMKATDPSRIVNGHSGELLYVNEQLRAPRENPYVAADMTDVHAYPDPMNSLKQTGKAQVVGEFGGIGVFIPNHQWNPGSQWGYVQEKPGGLKAKYTIMNQHLKIFEGEGMSGSIYTQPYDVESEQNGLMTYDREVVKIPFAELRKIHSQLNPEIASPNWLAMTTGVEEGIKDADLTEPGAIYSAKLQQFIDGKKDAAFLKELLMLAGQNGDKAGASRFGVEYLATLKEPYSAEDLEFMEGMTKKVSDKGFGVLLERAKSDRNAYVKAMNIIYADVIAGHVPTPQSKPDWAAVEAAVKPYGEPGEEMYLRAKAVHTINQQDWALYKPTAKVYLEKYGANLPDNEKQALQKAINDN